MWKNGKINTGGKWSELSGTVFKLLFSATLPLLLFGCGGGGGGGSSTVVIPDTTPYSVSGKVVDANGNGVSGVVVSISSTPKLVAKTVESTSSTTTDANGNYAFSVPKGTYTVSSADPLYGFTSQGITVIGVNTPSVPNITAYPLFSFTGKITLAGSLLPGATVTLYNTIPAIYTINGLYGATVTQGSLVATATTGADGSYKFTAVRSGSYTVKPSYLNADGITAKYVFQLATLLTLNDSGVVTITDNRMIYLYDPGGRGNQIAGNGTIIYNSQAYPLANNTISGIDFLAAVPGGTIN